MDVALKKFLPHLKSAILDAGALAIRSQKDIVNIGKEYVKVVPDEPDNEWVKQRAMAKTVIDEKIQELLLNFIKNRLGTDGIQIQAEEDTPTKLLFGNNNPNITFIIDPIDGTFEYTRGSDKYSIVVGIVQNGQIIASFNYYPAQKKLYFLDTTGKSTLTTINGQELSVPMKRPRNVTSRIVFVNNRVPADFIITLEKEKMNVIQDKGDVSWDEALLKCISGEYCACYFHTPQSRDILFGAYIQNMPGGYMKDWDGNNIGWLDGGRIPQVMFGFETLSEPAGTRTQNQ